MMRTGKKGRVRAVSIIKIVLESVLLLVGAALLALSFYIKAEDWREFDPSLITEAPRALRIYDREGALIDVSGSQKRIPISINELKETTVNAFIAAEDARFYTHSGLDVYRIFGAAWADIKAGGYVQGASTISQQLIKLSHLSSEKTLDRKLEEALLALRLERSFGKDEIMEMYLNYIYFGSGYYGIEAASLGYFGVHASELTTAQSAQLAGILKSPSAYAPHIDMDASISRRDNVLNRMSDNGFITAEELAAAKKEVPELSNAIPSCRNELTDLAVSEAAEILGKDRSELLEGGYEIHTTIDTGLNEYCHELFEDNSFFPNDEAQAALMILDSHAGIIAMCGGRGGYSPAGINRAIGSRRQPGSLIKPILVYAPAIEQYGYTPETRLTDSPKSFGDYSPRNSDDKYYGQVALSYAVSRSLNIPAVSVLSDIGLPSAYMFAERMGVDLSRETPRLPMALGGFTYGVTVKEMAGAFSVFQRGGTYIEPTCVERIIDGNGKVIYERNIGGEMVMREETANAMTSMLMEAVTDGTAKRLYTDGIELAAKTGTSVVDNGVRDAWCAAYSPEYTAVVWMGTDSAAEGSLPEDAVGGNHPALLLKDVFRTIYRERECPRFADEAYVARSSEKENVASETQIPASYPALPPEIVGWSISLDGKPVISFESKAEGYDYLIVRTDEMSSDITEFELKGGKGYLSFTDETAVSGRKYVYVIYAVSSGAANENGGLNRGSPSKEMTIPVP